MLADARVSWRKAGVAEGEERARPRLAFDGGSAVRTALTRGVSPKIGECELTHVAREVIDLETAGEQHAMYEACLAGLGYEIMSLPPEPDLPDSVFVEDTAVVLDELAIVTRPGAESRRGEVESIAQALRQFRDLVRVAPPATLDGGDVLVAGRDVFVGLSGRSDGDGRDQLRAVLEPLGYAVMPVPVSGCLHLKSAVSQVGPGRLLVNRRWVDATVFRGYDLIDVDPAEPGAANALLVGGTVVFPARFVRTRSRLEAAGIDVAPVDISELAKAEGGVTCCSLIVNG